MARKYQPVIMIYVDGSCLGNPGPGGWAALLQLNDNGSITQKKLITGRSRRTTNNRMELRAVIAGLNAIKQPSQHVEIYSDSQYVVNGATTWLSNWKRNGWRTSQRKPVENRDLWKQLDTAIQRHSPVDFYWVKGHANNPHNETVDQAARQAAYEVTSEDKEDME